MEKLKIIGEINSLDSKFFALMKMLIWLKKCRLFRKDTYEVLNTIYVHRVLVVICMHFHSSTVSVEVWKREYDFYRKISIFRQIKVFT